LASTWLLKLSAHEPKRDKQINRIALLHPNFNNHFKPYFTSTMKKTLYRITMKKDGQKWRENIVEINNNAHLKNYFEKMNSLGWKIVGIEIALNTKTTI